MYHRMLVALLLCAFPRPAIPAPGDVVLQLAFDGDLRDASGHGNDAFAQNARFIDGQRNQGLQVGAAGASVSDRAELRLAPGLRLEGWVKLTGANTASQMIVRKDREYMLRTDLEGEGGNFSFFVFLDGWEPRVKSPVVPKTGEWYHWIAAWDGKELSLDVNGQVTRQARAGTPMAGDEPLEFGPLTGVLDDVSLANPQAAQTGVAHWAFDGDLRDDTGHGHDAAGPGAKFAAGRVSQAVDFNQALTVPDHPDLQVAPGFRIDCAVYFEKLPPSYGYIAIKEGEYQLRVNSPGEGYHFAFFVNLGGGWEPRVQSPVVAKPGVWYRLSAKWDGQRLILDVNGQRTEAIRSGLPKPTANPVVMGPFDGRLDDLRLENPKLPLLRVRELLQEHTLLTAGRAERLTGVVENLGSPAEGVTAALSLQQGVKCLGDAKLALGNLGTGESKPVEWTVQADQAVSSLAWVQLSAGDYKPEPYRRWVAFFGDTNAPQIPQVSLPAAPGTTWYVDGVAGDNGRAGTSPETAWRDFTRVNGKVLGAGERLLIKRGSVINQELQVTARGAADRWAEIGTYGEGPRPVIHRNWDIADRCVLIADPDHLYVHGLIVCYAGKGLVVQYRGGNHAGLVIEDCIAHHIEGLYRFNAHGIPEWRDRDGAPGDGLGSSAGFAVVGNTPRDVLLRDLEMFSCSWGYFVLGDNITVDRVFVHHDYVHNTSPHPAMVAIRRSFLQNSILDASGGHASAGTMGIMLVEPEGLVIRNVHWRNVPDSKSHDEGGIDFEATGNGILVDRCTFEHNAGAAIEVLGLQSPQPRNVEIAGSRFIQNNLAHKLGPGEIYVWGPSSADVCCSTGVVHDCGYTTIPGVEFFSNQAPKTTSWTLRDNTSYPSPEALRKAMPLNEPPAADAGPDVWSDQASVKLTGTATDDGRPGGKALAVRWEMLEGPGPVAFHPADAAATTADFPASGDYLLRLVADDGELWHSTLVRVHRVPPGTATAKVFEFNHQFDKEGWTEADLGTKVETWQQGRWDSKAEPVMYVSGGYYIVAIKDSTTAHLASPDNLGTDLAAAKVLRLRLMNHTPATHMRLRFTTAADPAWDDRKGVLFEVSPNDTAPRAYAVDLARQPGWTGRLKQLRLDLATGTPLTGTCRLDYVWLGSAGGSLR
ncbi:MAG: hypothetical protein HYU66_17930 [Armatimonadetes bacterium]|nr:hypothetical protein [Armatimonadota bacterium]